MPEPGTDSPWAAAEPAGGGLSTAAPEQPAAATHPPGHTACPRCHHSVDQSQPGPWLECHACSWSGRVFWFSPLRDEAAVGEAATPDDAVCAHHPGRRADAVCAGSGAYVCPLCAVRLNGKVFDAAYVEAGGRTDLDEALKREMPRPDRAAIQSAVAALFLFFVAPVFALASLVYVVKHLRRRKADPLYRLVSRHGWTIVAALFSLLSLLVFAAGLLALLLEEGYL